MPARAGRCGFYYVCTARRKELSLVLSSSSSEVLSLTKFSTDFQKFSVRALLKQGLHTNECIS